jgi:exopolysaccharide biosynthesis polyprenyl glycosylphosphotransferase
MTSQTTAIGYTETGVHPRLSPYPLSVQRAIWTAWLVLTDVVVLDWAFALAFWIRFDLQITVAPEVIPNPDSYQNIATMLIPLWLAVFVGFNLYDRHANLGGIAESSRILNACTTAAMLVIVISFMTPSFVISRMWLVGVWLLSFAFVALNRFLGRRVVYSLRRRGYLVAPAMIVGTNQEAVSLAKFLMDWRSSGIYVLGYVTTRANDESPDSTLPVLGPVRDALAIIKEHAVEEVIVAITDIPRDNLLTLCEEVDSSPVKLRLSSGLYELLTTRVTVQTLGTVPVISLHKNRLDRAEAGLKTVLDVALSLAALVVLAPLCLLIGVLIKLDSAGPVIYRRRVLGVNGKQFDAYKFRTMHVNGAQLLQPEALARLQVDHKLKVDPRITRVGKWLRKFSLDEIPQLVNVLRRQMSLVGPRMITPAEAEKYGRQRMNLLSVKPGITGLWQVSGRSDVSYEERVRIDMFYVRNYTVWLDLQILFIETFPAVVKGRGAY